MQKSFEIRTAKPEDYDGLKKLWTKCFDDSSEAIDNFFEKTVTPENVVATFDNGKAVNAMYLVECEIKISGVKYNALYIYAVCTDPLYRGKGIMTKAFEQLCSLATCRKTDYLFLVPAAESLFRLYEKLGFKTGFTYKEKRVYKNEAALPDSSVSVLSYENYKKLRDTFFSETTLATLGERGFNSFLLSVGDTIRSFSSDSGYAVFEIENEQVIIHELFGDEKALTNCVLDLCGKDTAILRVPAKDDCCVAFGMYRALGDVPEIKNAFFGIPYGG